MNQNNKFNPQEYNIISTIKESNCSIDYLVENKETKKRYFANVNLDKSNLQTDSQKRIISNELGILINLHHPLINNFIAYSFSDFNNKKNITILKKYTKYEALSSIINRQIHGNCSEKYNNTKRQIILIGICFGMIYIHKNHVLHRNLKPENILLDDNFHPMISNIGIAPIIDSQNLSDYKNFTYLAPEILKNNQYSEKSDVYAFGMLIYEIIFGCRCYSNIIDKKHFDEERLKSKIIKGLRPKFIKPIKKGLQQIIERCWSANLFDRPTFSELYNAFTGKEEVFKVNNKNDFDYILDDVNMEEMMNYIEKIQNESNEESNDNYQSEINSLKTEMETMKEIIIQQNNEIKDLKQIINDQSELMNSKIMQEHCELQNMREFILNQIRKEFILYKKHSYPTRLLSKLDKMFRDHYVIKLFIKYCTNKMCIEYYYYVEDMNAYYEMKEELKTLLFYDFRDKYFVEGAPYFLNIKTNVIREIDEASEPVPELLDKALELVYFFYKVELIRKFKRYPQYTEYVMNVKKHKTKRGKRKKKA